MRETKYLLIGGGLASSQAAKMIAMKAPGEAITLVCGEPHLPYDRPPLSKALLQGQTTPEKIAYDSYEFYDDKSIDVRIGVAVTGLDPDAHTVALSDGRAVRYKKAFLATGGTPLALPVDGNDLDGVFTLRTVDDSLAIAAAARLDRESQGDAANRSTGSGGAGRRAVVVGAGFIGMEVAASLAERGIGVTVIEAESRIWPAFLDETLSGFIEKYCRERGVEFRTGDRVDALMGGPRVNAVRLESGVEIPCDFVCVGIGIRPNLELAETAGLEIERGVVVDEHLRTSHPDIYAGGDIVNYPDPVFGRRRVEHWGHAEYCGQVAGLNMTGNAQKYDLLSYVWSEIFDLRIDMAGDERDRDRTLVRGDMDAGAFIVLYLKGDRVRAYFAVNGNKRQFPSLQKLIRRGVDVSAHDAQLQDPDFDLKKLLK